MQLLALPMLGVPAAFGYWAWRNHRRIVDRDRERFFAALRSLGFRIEGREPWVARGKYAERSITISTEPVGIGVPGRLSCTRFTVHAPTGVERACAYLRTTNLLRWADMGKLTPVALSPTFDRKLAAAAVRPADLESRLDEEKRRWVERRGGVFWIEIGAEDTTLCVDGLVETLPRLLDCVDFVSALVEQRPLARPFVAPKLRLGSYWSAAFAATVIAVPVTFWACAIVPVDPFLRAGLRDPLALALSFDAVWAVSMLAVGVFALVSPVTPEPRGH